MEVQKVVGEVVKNFKGEKYVVSEILEDGVCHSVDIRQGFLNENDEFVMTKKGIRLKADKFEELREILNKIVIN